MWIGVIICYVLTLPLVCTGLPYWTSVSSCRDINFCTDFLLLETLLRNGEEVCTTVSLGLAVLEEYVPRRLWALFERDFMPNSVYNARTIFCSSSLSTLGSARTSASSGVICFTPVLFSTDCIAFDTNSSLLSNCCKSIRFFKYSSVRLRSALLNKLLSYLANPLITSLSHSNLICSICGSVRATCYFLSVRYTSARARNYWRIDSMSFISWNRMLSAL